MGKTYRSYRLLLFVSTAAELLGCLAAALVVPRVVIVPAVDEAGSGTGGATVVYMFLGPCGYVSGRRRGGCECSDWSTSSQAGCARSPRPRAC